MKKKIILLIILSFCFVKVNAISNKFNFDISEFSFEKNSKKNDLVNNFNDEYKLNYSISTKDEELENEIEILTKKTTYLLLGKFNNIDETSNNFYKRKRDFYNLRYNPEIPLNANNELDTNSQEYKDDIISGLSIPSVFNQATEYQILYGSYGSIRVIILEDLVMSSLVLPNVKLKVKNNDNPARYSYIETNFVMHYYYKKLNDEWKLYYLYGESADDVKNYFNKNEFAGTKNLDITEPYNSQLDGLYNFDKLNNVSDNELSNIYSTNANNIVFFNGYYNNSVVSSANGFFINNGLVVTTWNFLEKSLINAQYITVKVNNDVYEIDGIVTANPKTDVAVIKLKNEYNSNLKIGNFKALNLEDPIFTISSKLGTDLTLQKGIIISNEDYVQTSIPLLDVDEGSPLFNINGEVIGMNTSKSTNDSISVAINSDVLMEIQDKFNSIDYDSIDAISFDNLKEKYYYTRYEDENVNNNIPKNKWNMYSKIGNIEDTINLNLLNASYQNGIVSLRYKNEVPQYISSMQLAVKFREQLINEGYKEVLNNDTKKIYENSNYQIIIMDEFDYLIIVMVKL